MLVKHAKLCNTDIGIVSLSSITRADHLDHWPTSHVKGWKPCAYNNV